MWLQVTTKRSTQTHQRGLKELQVNVEPVLAFMEFFFSIDPKLSHPMAAVITLHLLRLFHTDIIHHVNNFCILWVTLGMMKENFIRPGTTPSSWRLIIRRPEVSIIIPSARVARFRSRTRCPFDIMVLKNR